MESSSVCNHTRFRLSGLDSGRVGSSHNALDLLLFFFFFVLSYCYPGNISYYVDHKTRWNLQEYPFPHNAAQSAVLNVDFSFVVGSHHVVLTSCFRKPRKYKFLPSRRKYYPNSNSTFQLQRFLISGDILPNPGQPKCPCSRCEKPCKSNQRAMRWL